MEPSIIAVVCVSAAAVVAVLAVRAARRQRSAGKRACGSCGRALLENWDRCPFCGWRRDRGEARLDFVGGPLKGQTVALGAETTLGSVSGNDIVVADPAVSRTHFTIRRVSGHYELLDNGSTNGVYVNGAKKRKAQLRSGDELRIGNCAMVFVDD